MKRSHITVAFALLLFAFTSSVFAQTPAERVVAIQAALRETKGDAKLDGWLFYDFRKSDPLAYRILKLDEKGITTRRWFYYIPVSGEPVKIVHSIERFKLDQLPGKKVIYRSWQELHESLREAMTKWRRPHPRNTMANDNLGTVKHIAMQFSPNNDIPYVSRVDAGTIDLLRSLHILPVTSANLVQQFEAVWTPAQREMHTEAANKIHRIIMESFAEIARRDIANQPTTEYDIQQFMVRRFEEEGLTSDGEDPNVSVNANSANPHYQPDSKTFSPIRRGDFVLFDVWAKLKKPGAVYADQTWTGFVGKEVPLEVARVFNIVREARDAAVTFIRASLRGGKTVRAAEVDDVARGVIVRAGYGDYFTHRTGHSIGEEVHGNGAHIDNLETKDSRHIIPRTCFSIEPGIYLDGRFGVRSEINVYVAEKEIEVTGGPVQTEVIAILKK
ncbi:MAG TPA: M24 family metallopeptidase [Pyrinomonadaceae bacterium]|nr:M24 family metallopeptidase [Pyrinomonadaceae bacterium]